MPQQCQVLPNAPLILPTLGLGAEQECERVSDYLCALITPFSVPAPWSPCSPLADPSRMPGANIHRTSSIIKSYNRKWGSFYTDLKPINVPCVPTQFRLSF